VPAFASVSDAAGSAEDLVYLLQFGNPCAYEGDGAKDAPGSTPAYGVAVGSTWRVAMTSTRTR
jgi:hypothetical protein